MEEVADMKNIYIYFFIIVCITLATIVNFSNRQITLNKSEKILTTGSSFKDRFLTLRSIMKPAGSPGNNHRMPVSKRL
jgi:hypothetical protein